MTTSFENVAAAWALDKNQNRLLAALTIAALRELGGDSLFISEDDHPCKWSRMARVQDILATKTSMRFYPLACTNWKSPRVSMRLKC